MRSRLPYILFLLLFSATLFVGKTSCCLDDHKETVNYILHELLADCETPETCYGGQTSCNKPEPDLNFIVNSSSANHWVVFPVNNQSIPTFPPPGIDMYLTTLYQSVLKSPTLEQLSTVILTV